MRNRARLVLILAGAMACTGPGQDATGGGTGPGGKADGYASERDIEVILTEPYCDVCTPDDKDVLVPRSRIVARAVELIDGARDTIDVAQFTFSVPPIEEALVRARERGVRVRLAIDKGQDMDGSVARRLADAGLDVKFVTGKPPSAPDRPAGLQHAKFMMVDGDTLMTGSNNWSSTGTSINEENTIVVQAPETDPLIQGFGCHFEAIWSEDLAAAAGCARDGVAFAPGSAAIGMIKEQLRGARTSIDVIMHQLLFDDLIDELIDAAERGVRVRVIVNAEDRAEMYSSADWERFAAAGGEMRFKRTNADLYQLTHHKLAIVDGQVLLDGSGNWSGSGFFNNWENYVRWDDPRVLRPFRALFARLWTWSLTGESLDAGRTPAEQHTASTRIYFGNLHSHFHGLSESGKALDDGRAERKTPEGESYAVDVGESDTDAARFAFEYARDMGKLDFMALSPHCADDGALESDAQANMSVEGFEHLASVAHDVSEASTGSFVAIPAMEWSTISAGNHVTILGSRELSKVTRGRYDELYGEWLPNREWAGDRPLVTLNHPKTMRQNLDTLEGNWDQVFGVSLLEVENASDRANKFNDYGLDDFSPMSDVRASWIDGTAMPDESIVRDTLASLWAASSPYVRAMEVTLGRGTEIGTEDSQNPDLVVNPDTGAIERVFDVHTELDYYLLRGFRVAPIASHDNHLANWGAGHSSRTCVHAESLSEDAILDALDRREVYASEDENLEMHFFAEDRIPMGSEHRTPADRVAGNLFLNDADWDGAFEVRLFSGRIGGDAVDIVQELSVAEGTWQPLVLSVPAPGEYFFYVEVYEPSSDRMAWSAPIWIERL